MCIDSQAASLRTGNAMKPATAMSTPDTTNDNVYDWVVSKMAPARQNRITNMDAIPIFTRKYHN